MRRIKFLALVGIVTIAYIIGICIGFGICATTQSATAKPIVTNVQSTHSTQNVSYDYIYVNGTRYIVFMSSTGDIEVVR